MAIYRGKEIQSAFGSSQEVSDTALAKEYQLCWVQSSNAWHFRTFLQYDLSGIPYKSQITSAKLRVYDRWHNDNGASGTTNIARVTETWDENTLCWNLMPESSGLYLAESVSPPGVDTWSDWDITTLVQEWVNLEHPNYGLAIVNNNEESYRVDWQFYNRYYNNGSHASYIEIEYEPEPELKITQARLTEIADQARRLTGTTVTLTPKGIRDALAALEL